MGQTAYDVVIAGGGPVGAALAALAPPTLRIAVVEPRAPEDAPAAAGAADRAIALAEGSRRILEEAGAWAGIAPAAAPIRYIHVSQRGRPGITRLRCDECGVEALGWVVPGPVLERALAERLAALGHVERISRARVAAVAQDGTRVRVRLEGEGPEALEAALLVGADGTASRVREAVGIGTEQWDYGQDAVLATLETGRAHGGWAYERFTDDGPLALLPLGPRRMALVWTLPRARAPWALGLVPEAFAREVQARFGWRLGRLRLAAPERAAHPLRMVRAREAVRGRVALVGNAMRTLHPVAGQGFNLGLRDARALARLLEAAAWDGADPGRKGLLARYAARRARDQWRVLLFTELLVRGFTLPLAPVAWARGAALGLLELLPPARRALARAAMGVG